MPVYMTKLITPREAATESPRNFFLFLGSLKKSSQAYLRLLTLETGGGTQQTSLKANLNVVFPRKPDLHFCTFMQS